jgi:hypothetical protein
MLGVPGEKSWRMIVSTTFVLLACAVASKPVRALELQTLHPESAAMLPIELICKPKNATVLSAEKFQLG